MALLKKNSPGCASNPSGCGCGGGCLVTFTVNAKCSSTLVTGTLIELLDAAGTTVLQSCTGSSCVFTSVDGSLAHNVRVSKTGYHTKTYSVAALGCAGPYTYDAIFWPTTYSVTFTINPCLVVGATVDIGGDDTDSGVTNGSGQVTFTLSSTSTALNQSLTYTITPPAGFGMAAVGPIAFTENPCTPTNQSITLTPSAGHTSLMVNGRFLPTTLNWSETYGSCSCTPSGFAWSGSFTYVSTQAVTGVVCPGPFDFPLKNQTVTITVNIAIVLDNSGYNPCSSGVFRIVRTFLAACGGDCSALNNENQPSDSLGYASNDYAVLVDSVSGPATVTLASGAISQAMTVPTRNLDATFVSFHPFPPEKVCVGDVAESATSGTFTGTIT